MPATRTNRKGRAKGGIITGVKKCIEESKEPGIENKDLQERRIKTGNNIIRIFTIYNRQDEEDNTWDVFKEVLEDEENEKILVGGDFNARIGKYGVIERGKEIKFQQRASKDSVINKRGREMLKLCQERGWHILNGNIKGDEKGSLTYLGEQGESVIDYILGNENLIEDVDEFIVEENTESDHLPVTAKMNIEVDRLGKEYATKNSRKIQIWNKTKVELYKSKSRNVILEKIKSVNEDLEQLLKAVDEIVEKREIKNANNNELRWWDSECRAKRKELRKCLKQVKEEKSTIESYRLLRRQYKILCKNKKENMRSKVLQEIKEIKNEAEVWTFLNKYRKKRNRGGDTEITIEDWRTHFMQILEGQESRNKDSEYQERQESLTDEEIEEQINRLKNGKAPGEDGTKNEAWIYADGQIKNKLKEIIKRVHRGEGFPDRWRKGVIIPIHKKGEKENPHNYRGITLLNTSFKIYAMILGEQLKKEAEKVLPESQAGFRQGRSCMDQIFILNWLVERELIKKGGKLFVFFVDFKAAFDTVNRRKLWEIMQKKGISKELIDRIREIYENTECQVVANGACSQTFSTYIGVRQGCPMSPTLFALYLSDLDEKLAAGQAGGVVVGKTKVWTLAYADDVAMVAKEEREMKEMLKELEKYTERKKLTVNVEKSKIMVFKKGRGKKEKFKWVWRNEEIEEVKEFRYLGYQFQKNNGPEAHIKVRCKKAIIAMKQAWGFGKRLFQDNFERRMHLFDYLVKSVLFYGVEIWGWSEEIQVESLHERFIRWTLELDKSTPGYMVREETKRNLLRIETGRLALKFELRKRNKNDNKILQECLKEMDRENNNNIGKWKKRREDYFHRNGLSVCEGLRRAQIGTKKLLTELKNRDEAVQHQENLKKIDKSKYNPHYKEIVLYKRAKYLKEFTGKGNQKMKARWRCGNEEKQNRYWEADVSKKQCRICGQGAETLEHLRSTCERDLRTYMNRNRIMSTKEGEMWMRKVLEKRKSKELN